MIACLDQFGIAFHERGTQLFRALDGISQERRGHGAIAGAERIQIQQA